MTHGVPKRLELSLAPDGTIVLRGEIDMATAPDLRAALDSAPPGLRRVDLRAVDYLDSAGLSVLYDHSRSLHLTALPDSVVAAVLDISGLSELTTVELAPAVI